jgi:DNA-binding transcriptional regulator GbsR (MarR family)
VSKDWVSPNVSLYNSADEDSNHNKDTKAQELDKEVVKRLSKTTNNSHLIAELSKNELLPLGS